jgi:pectin methylesterase-like acyl-CoA thioesterase
MKKIFIITLAFGLAISVANFTSSAYAAVWSVPGDFATIQEAIDSPDVADTGDTIMVGPGEYAGAIVTKAVEIKGVGGAVINEGTWLGAICENDLIIGFEFGT